MRKSNQDAKEKQPSPARLRCAIYTRKSTEEGLDQEFNSLDAQREAGEAFIQSQRREGWIALPEFYDDGGYTGGNMDRPALTRNTYCSFPQARADSSRKLSFEILHASRAGTAKWRVLPNGPAPAPFFAESLRDSQF